MGIHSELRTLEAPRGNRYAPARGMHVMIMMMMMTVAYQKEDINKSGLVTEKFNNI